MKNTKRIFGGMFAILLSACGGGGGSNTPSGPTTTGVQGAVLTDAQIVTYLKSANTNYDFNSNGIKGSDNGRPVGTWRWSNTPDQHILVYIPPPSNSVEKDLASKVQVAINAINSKVGTYLILEAVNVLPAMGHVIQVGYNNAWVPPGGTDYNSYCANVSTAAGLSYVVTPDLQNNIPNSVFMNLGNNHCNVTQDIVTHEFGHALGFSSHFDVFGNTKSPDNFWDVLATLYGNPQSTTAENLVIKRAAK